jgi:hypothetical protein
MKKEKSDKKIKDCKMEDRESTKYKVLSLKYKVRIVTGLRLV